MFVQNKNLEINYLKKYIMRWRKQEMTRPTVLNKKRKIVITQKMKERKTK